jgi:hypothetical protein
MITIFFPRRQTKLCVYKISSRVVLNDLFLVSILRFFSIHILSSSSSSLNIFVSSVYSQPRKLEYQSSSIRNLSPHCCSFLQSRRLYEEQVINSQKRIITFSTFQAPTYFSHPLTFPTSILQFSIFQYVFNLQPCSFLQSSNSTPSYNHCVDYHIYPC